LKPQRWIDDTTVVVMIEPVFASRHVREEPRRAAGVGGLARRTRKSFNSRPNVPPLEVGPDDPCLPNHSKSPAPAAADGRELTTTARIHSGLQEKASRNVRSYTCAKRRQRTDLVALLGLGSRRCVTAPPMTFWTHVMESTFIRARGRALTL
jgi:hypothetical protein